MRSAQEVAQQISEYIGGVSYSEMQRITRLIQAYGCDQRFLCSQEVERQPTTTLSEYVRKDTHRFSRACRMAPAPGEQP